MSLRRALCAVTLLVAGRGFAKPPGAHAGASSLGTWGEDLHLVPSFAPTEERRAPKLPDSGPIFEQLAAHDPLGEAPVVEDALLVCYADIASRCARTNDRASWSIPNCGHDWDTFNGPDPLFRFQLGNAHPIALWGPEDHWEMYVSIPRLTLHKGDRLQLRAWDRDVTTNEYIGQAEARFDGHFPIALRSRYLDVECRATDGAQALTMAGPRLAAIDADLDAVQTSLAPGHEVWMELERRRAGLEAGHQKSFRYAAGFVGWEHPAIQERLTRLRSLEEAWEQASARLPSASETNTFANGRLTVTVAKVVCGAPARAIAGRSADRHSCAITVTWRHRDGSPVVCSELDRDPSVLHRRGGWLSSNLVRTLDDAGHEVPCAADTDLAGPSVKRILAVSLSFDPFHPAEELPRPRLIEIATPGPDAYSKDKLLLRLE